MSALTEAIVLTSEGWAAVHAAAGMPSALEPDELLAALVEIQHLLAQGEAANALLLALVDLAMLPADEHGQSSTASAVATHAGTNPRLTRAVQRRGLWLLAFPIISEAFSTGRLSQAHVEAIRAVDNPRTSAALFEAQAYLVQAAVDCTWNEFQNILRYWALGADPDGEEPADQVDKRAVRFKTNQDGSVSGRFQLDPLAGHAFTTAIDRILATGG